MVLAYGEILWDLLPAGAVLGGAPFNFIFRVNSLGGRGVMISRLGRDELGDRALREIVALGLDPCLIQRDPARPTGTVPVRLDERGSPEFTILPEVAYDNIQPGAELQRAVEQAEVVCFGTLVQRSQVSRQTLWALLEHFRGRWLLLDINLRKDCWTPQSVTTSVARAHILKLNDEEARVLGRIYALDGEDLVGFAQGMLQATRLQYVVITLGERGALAAARSGSMVYHPAYRVEPVDTVGSGDAFTAAFLMSLLRGGGLKEALRDGNALGALVARQRGATQPADAQALAAFRGSTPLGPAVEELEGLGGQAGPEPA